MSFINLEHIQAREMVSGYHARFIHSEHMTLAYWEIEAGAVLPEHKHPHEQVANILEGEFEFTLAGEKCLCKPGSVVIIPSNVQHSAVALTPCKILDVFYPIRAEYRF